MRHRNDEINGVLRESVVEIATGTFRQSGDETFAGPFFPQKAGRLEMPFVDSPADDPVESKFLLSAAGTEVFRFEERAERFAATGALIFADVGLECL